MTNSSNIQTFHPHRTCGGEKAETGTCNKPVSGVSSRSPPTHAHTHIRTHAHFHQHKHIVFSNTRNQPRVLNITKVHCTGESGNHKLICGSGNHKLINCYRKVSSVCNRCVLHAVVQYVNVAFTTVDISQACLYSWYITNWLLTLSDHN